MTEAGDGPMPVRRTNADSGCRRGGEAPSDMGHARPGPLRRLTRPGTRSRQIFDIVSIALILAPVALSVVDAIRAARRATDQASTVSGLVVPLSNEGFAGREGLRDRKPGDCRGFAGALGDIRSNPVQMAWPSAQNAPAKDQSCMAAIGDGVPVGPPVP